MRSWVRGALLLVLVPAVLPSVPASAAEQAASRPGPGRAGGAVAPGELADMLDTYVIVEAQRSLQLDDDDYARFVPAVKRLQSVRRRRQRERARLLQDLRRLAGPQIAAPAPDGQIRERLETLRRHDEQAAAELAAAYEAVDEVLTPSQQARFRLLEETIERRKLELLSRARQQAGRGRDDR